MEDARIATPRLEYAQPPPWHRRRTAQRIVFGFSIAVLVGGLTLWLPTAWRRTQLLYWQQRCLEYQPQEGRVAQELAGANVLQTNSVEAWDKFDALYEPPGGKYHNVIFLGKLKTPAGSPRLVHIFCNSTALIYADVLDPGTFWTNARRAGVNPDLVGVLGGEPGQRRVFEGRADPRVPSHFSFDYEIDGTRYTMDGWLHDDGTVALSDRSSDVQASSIVPGATSKPGEMTVP